MKKFYAVETDMLLRVLAYNLFVLFRHEFLGEDCVIDLKSFVRIG